MSMIRGNLPSPYLCLQPFLCYTTIMLNSATIHAIRKTSSLPKTVKTLLLSLAVSDLGVGLLVQPLFVARLVMEMEQKTKKNAFYDAALSTFYAIVRLLGFLLWCHGSQRRQIHGCLFFPLIQGTCDSQACCFFYVVNLVVQCIYFVY